MDPAVAASIAMTFTICLLPLGSNQGDSDALEAEKDAQQALAALLSADDLEKMCALPKQWTSMLSPEAQKRLVFALLKKLEPFPTRKLRTLARYGSVVNNYEPQPP